MQLLDLQRKAVFLDRDGVINRQPANNGYVTRPEDFEVLPGVADAVRRLNGAGFLVIVVTNQKCISTGLVTGATVAAIHERMLKTIESCQARIDQIYVCPHDDRDGCECRKPRPGMLLRAAREFSLELANCWMVGDRESDVETGQAVGCRTVLISESPSSLAGSIAANLPDAVEQILNHTN